MFWDWKTIKDTGVWYYQENIKTKERRIISGPFTEYQPRNTAWLTNDSTSYLLIVKTLDLRILKSHFKHVFVTSAGYEIVLSSMDDVANAIKLLDEKYEIADVAIKRKIAK